MTYISRALVPIYGIVAVILTVLAILAPLPVEGHFGSIADVFISIANVNKWVGIVAVGLYTAVAVVQLAALELPTTLSDTEILEGERKCLIRLVAVIILAFLFWFAPYAAYARLMVQPGFLNEGSIVYALCAMAVLVAILVWEAMRRFGRV